VLVTKSLSILTLIICSISPAGGMELFFGKFIALFIGINGATTGVVSKTYHSLLDLDTFTRDSAVF
jgi:hypothetical protein